MLLSPESPEFFDGFLESGVIFLDSCGRQSTQELANTDEARVRFLKDMKQDILDRFSAAEGNEKRVSLIASFFIKEEAFQRKAIS